MSIIHLLFSIELVVFAVCRFMPENVLLKNNQVPWFKNLQTQHTHLHTLTHKHLTKCNNNKKNNLIMIVIKWIPYIRLAIWGVFFLYFYYYYCSNSTMVFYLAKDNQVSDNVVDTRILLNACYRKKISLFTRCIGEQWKYSVCLIWGNFRWSAYFHINFF